MGHLHSLIFGFAGFEIAGGICGIERWGKIETAGCFLPPSSVATLAFRDYSYAGGDGTRDSEDSVLLEFEILKVRCSRNSRFFLKIPRASPFWGLGVEGLSRSGMGVFLIDKLFLVITILLPQEKYCNFFDNWSSMFTLYMSFMYESVTFEVWVQFPRMVVTLLRN